MSAELTVEEVVVSGPRVTQCAVRCLTGTLRLGDALTTAVRDGRVLAVELEVVEIHRYQGVMVDELETNFGALLYLAGTWPAAVGPRWLLRTADPSAT